MRTESREFRTIESAIHFIAANAERQPTLAEVARTVHLSEYHFQRLFRRWVGVSPKRFLQAVTLRRAKERLGAEAGVLQTAYDVGLSGSGRLHDLFVTLEAVTPGEHRSGGAGLDVSFGVHPTPFGDCLIGTTPRGVCAMHFLDGDADPVAILRESWPAAQLREDQRATAEVARLAFGTDRGALSLLVRGTNFQVRVWEALLRVAPGEVTTYAELAADVGRPAAARAVGSAVARNQIACLIPCHRVVRKVGGIGEYRWGAGRKRALLAWEGARPERRAG